MEVLILGLIAGIAPSPHNLTLLGLSINSSFKKCLRFCLEALLFDILLVTVILIQKNWIDHLIPYLGILKIVSLNYIIYLCFRFMNSKSAVPALFGANGFLVQAINPNPYMFWIFVGFPYFVNYGLSKFLVFSMLFLFIAYSVKVLIFVLFKSFQKTIYETRYFQIGKVIVGLTLLILANYNFLKI